MLTPEKIKMIMDRFDAFDLDIRTTSRREFLEDLATAAQITDKVVRDENGILMDVDDLLELMTASARDFLQLLNLDDPAQKTLAEFMIKFVESVKAEVEKSKQNYRSPDL